MSGGTTSVINATLAGIINQAQNSPHIDKIFAGFPGLLGAIKEDFIELSDYSDYQLDIIRNSPGSASIGTTRTKIFNEQELKNIEKLFKSHNIGYFINIGGNGTIKQTQSIAKACKDIFIAAAPKTVDNDLGDSECDKMWYTPGFPSCVNYWFHKTLMLNNENAGAFSHDKVLIAQTFGRDTGFIVGSMRISDPNRQTPLILLIPEDQRSPKDVVKKIKNTVKKHGRAVVGLSEGYKIKEYNFKYDLSGQPMYGSSNSTSAQELVNLCMENDIQARSYIPTIDQRQNFEYTLESDLDIAYSLGEEIISNFNKQKTHFFQTFTRSGMDSIPLSSISNFSRKMKKEWIDYGNYDVTDKYLEYLKSFTLLSPSRDLYVGGKLK